MLIIKLLGTVAAADFVSGFVHWLEDAYARPEMPLVGGIARDNLRHHAKPREFLEKSWWASSYDLFFLGLALLALAWRDHALTPWVALFAVLVVNANQIHKWAHSSRQELPRLVRCLQRWKILQSPREHAKHHSGDRNTHYCVITSFLNPVLERVSFWLALEGLVWVVTGVWRRFDWEYL